MCAHRLKIGLIVDSTQVSPYLHELALWASTQPDVSLTHLILQDLPPAPVQSRLQKLQSVYANGGSRAVINRLLWALLYRYEVFRLKRIGKQGHFARHDIAPLVPEIIRVTPTISKSGFIYRYPPEAIDAIRAEGFDVLLRGGSGILRGDILTAAQLGVLSFHHGDNRVNRGGPPAFWEVLRRELTTGFVIQRLDDELDGGAVYVRGNFTTLPSWMLNQMQLYQRSNHFLKQLLLDIANTGQLPAPLPSLPYAHALYRLPGIRAQLSYLKAQVMDKLNVRVEHHVLRRTLNWGVAFQRRDWRTLVMHKAIRIDIPEGHFIADPFVITREGRDYCFVEDYDYAAKRGHVSAYELGDDKATALGVVLREPFHLSFPYLFEHEGMLYMIPESASNRDIRLYECVNFPREWKLVRTYMRDVSAVDSMVFRHGEHWWLFTNINPIAQGEHCSELYAFYSDDPIHGEWMPHAQNPLIVDPLCARNGGIILEKDAVYRVAQRQGFDLYGESMTVRKIVMLTPETFEEVEITHIQPEFYENAVGTHHLHSNGSVTVFDFLERVKR